MTSAIEWASFDPKFWTRAWQKRLIYKIHKELKMTEWISVKDCLPIPAQGQLCTDDILLGHPMWIRLGYLNGYKKWIAYTLEGDDVSEEVWPTHWMPKPEPPR